MQVMGLISGTQSMRVNKEGAADAEARAGDEHKTAAE
jgi:hypothetical protein